MAELFLATMEGPEGFRKRVVIKRLLPQLARRPSVVEMFLNEARLASRINHPNVVDILDLGQEGDDFFIAMEYLDGRSLADIEDAARDRGELVPVGAAARVLADACAGLHTAHGAQGDDGRPLGIVHRDFTPANVFVTYDGRVKVLDFGIAKSEALPSQTEPGALKGKYLYMSPEMVAGRPIDRRADLFAAGVMLYELLTGRLPFMGNSVRAVLASIALAKPIPPRNIEPNIPPDLEVICLELLHRNPEERPQTAGEVSTALETFLGSSNLAVGTIQLADYMSDLFPAATDAARQEMQRALASIEPEAAAPRRSISRPANRVVQSEAATPKPTRRPLPLVVTAVLALVVLAGGSYWAVHNVKLPGLSLGHRVAPEAAAEPPSPYSEIETALKSGKPETARALAEKLLQQDPSNAKAHALLGRSLLALRYGQRAEAEFREAIRLNPKSPDGYRGLGTLKTEQGDAIEATKAFEAALKIDPRDAETAAGLSRLYGLRGDWKQSLAMLETLYKQGVKTPDLYAEAGFARYQLGDDERAESDLQRALKLKPDLAKAHYYLGFVLYRKGQTEQAAQSYRTAANEDPKSTEALLALADLYKAQGQTQKASATYREVLARDPKNELATSQIAAAGGK
jgi:tetratricopeptide (TPR) repeat protein/tRNA A-37 threonylcarbamoyl transferase component Bud32